MIQSSKFGFSGLALAALLCSAPAWAHGPAEWINQGRYRNAAGELCCGEQDCKELPNRAVKAVAGGYHVKWWLGHQIDELVPYSEAQPSPDGHFWRCEYSGERKCFFAPPVGE